MKIICSYHLYKESYHGRIIWSAFVGGLLFFSPCILPIVPFYLSYMANGINVLSDDGELPRGVQSKAVHPGCFQWVLSQFCLVGGCRIFNFASFRTYQDEFR